MDELLFSVHFTQHAFVLRLAVAAGVSRAGRNRCIGAVCTAMAGCTLTAQIMDVQHFRTLDRGKLCEYVLADAAFESGLQGGRSQRMCGGQPYQQSAALDFGGDLRSRCFRRVWPGADAPPVGWELIPSFFA